MGQTSRRVKWVLIIALLSLVTYDMLIPLFVRTKTFGDMFVWMGRSAARLLPSRHEHDERSELATDLDYDDLNMWTSHYLKRDWADLVPDSTDTDGVTPLRDAQNEAPAALFFVYPTGFLSWTSWNSPVNVSPLSDPLAYVSDVIADATSMIHTTAYNGVARVYAPRYRQMTGLGFFRYEEEPEMVKRSLDVAYRDVKRAFEKFLMETGDAPILVAGHSQGSILAARLLKERLDPARHPTDYARFVAAYLIGASIFEGDAGTHVAPCAKPDSLKCYVGYNVFEEGGNHADYILRGFLRSKREPIKLTTALTEGSSSIDEEDPSAKGGVHDHEKMTCVNPLTFDLDRPHASASANPGSRPVLVPTRVAASLLSYLLGRESMVNFQGPLVVGAFGGECRHGVLFVNQSELLFGPRGFTTTGFFPGLNAHGSESNIFWLSTRKNAELRVRTMMAQEGRRRGG